MIVSNTSPLVAFSRINRLDVLRAFATHIVIPGAVAEELRVGARLDEPIVAALKAGEWLEIRFLPDSPVLRLLRQQVDRGEAEAVALALRLRGTVLMDDREGRAAAENLRVDYLGTLGVISAAKRSGLIAAAAPMVTALRKAGIYYRPDLIDAFLRDQGEA